MVCVCVFSTSPFVCGASPPGPEPSSVAPRWCRASSSSCTTRGFPYTTPGSACWCAVVGHKTQSPTRERKEKQKIYILNCEAGHVLRTLVMNFTLTGAFLSMGLMTNFLSLKEMFRISLQGSRSLVSTWKQKNMLYRTWPADGAQHGQTVSHEIIRLGFSACISEIGKNDRKQKVDETLNILSCQNLTGYL